MNHWQMITLAYGLTLAALTLEVVLLFRRRRQALRHALDGIDAADEEADAIGGSTPGSTVMSTAGLAAGDAAVGSGTAGARGNGGAAR